MIVGYLGGVKESVGDHLGVMWEASGPHSDEANKEASDFVSHGAKVFFGARFNASTYCDFV